MKIHKTTEILSDIFYDHTTGKIYSNRSGLTRELNSKQTSGYIQIHDGETNHLAHRLIWSYFNGPIPKNMQIDHKNLDKTDNRLENLRLVSDYENKKKRNLQKNNSSGFPGVSYHSPSGKYYACIGNKGERFNLGYYETVEEAATVYLKEKIRIARKKNCKHLIALFNEKFGGES